MDEPSGTEAQEPLAPSEDAVKLGKRWREEIAKAQRAQKKWEERGKKIEKIYIDERDMSEGNAARFNILWSNVETLRPAVYMQTPKPKVKRRHRDRDPVGRLTSAILERALVTTCELYDFDAAVDSAVRDRLVVGRGQAWVMYTPEIVGEGDQQDVAYEAAECVYVPWTDFLHGPAKQWQDVPWVARRTCMGRRELAKWVQERGLQVNLQAIEMDYGVENRRDGEGKQSQAQIWEIWDKQGGTVIYLAPGSNEHALLGQVPPPQRFAGFFPCPKPLLGTTTADNMLPVPDYVMYQTQAQELNRITARIGALQKALKVVGVYNGDNEAIGQLLAGTENEMIPVANWAMFAEGGGARGNIEWYPVEQVVSVIQSLYQQREQAKQTLYEVSGLGDVLRGVSDPSETATAQGIKAQWGSQRVKRLQKDVQRFVVDLLRLKAEILSEAVPFQQLLSMASIDQEVLSRYAPQGQEMAILMQVQQLLQGDLVRTFRIDIESDSTLEPDQQQEKQTAVEFVTAMSQYLEKAAPVAAQGPEVAKMVGELLLFAVRRFDKVDQLEQVVEQAVEAAAKPKPPAPPDPQTVKAQAEAEMGKAELQLKTQQMQMDAAMAQQKAQSDAELERERLALDREKLRLEALKLDLERQRLEWERERGTAEIVTKREATAMRQGPPV